MKSCRHCQSTEHLCNNKAFKDGIDTICTPCSSAKGKAHYSANREKRLAGMRVSHLRRSYGLTPSDFDAIVARQGDGCAVCGSDSKLVVDHNHTTGSVRGVLCSNCNTALGLLVEDPDRIKGLALYATLHTQK